MQEDSDLRTTLARALENLESLLSALPNKQAKDLRDRLKQVRELLLDQRPPRLALVGRRGSGKSSLINALFGEPIAAVGHEKAQTGTPSWFTYRSERGALELLDTRGLQEAHAPAEPDAARTPFDSILGALERTCPDALLFLVKATEVGTAMEEDLRQLERLNARLDAAHGSKVPIVAVLTQCDLVEPKDVRLHEPSANDPDEVEEKVARIKRLERSLSDLIRERSPLKSALVTSIGVSAYQSWRSDGRPRSDERWRVDDLVAFLYEELPREARIELVRLAQARKLQRKLARTLTGVVASACAALAATPIPVGDIAPITSLQITLVASIGYVAGRSLTLRTASEFLAAMGVNVGAGFALREAARALLKLVPGAGNLASGAVAFAGTLGIGEAAAAYFIDGASIESARARLRSARPGDDEEG